MSGKVTSDPSRRRDVAARGNRNVGALAEEHARARRPPFSSPRVTRSMPARSPDAPTPSSSDIPVIACITRVHRSTVGKKRSASSVVFGVRVRIESIFTFASASDRDPLLRKNVCGAVWKILQPRNDEQSRKIPPTNERHAVPFFSPFLDSHTSLPPIGAKIPRTARGIAARARSGERVPGTPRVHARAFESPPARSESPGARLLPRLHPRGASEGTRLGRKNQTAFERRR